MVSSRYVCNGQSRSFCGSFRYGKYGAGPIRYVLFHSFILDLRRGPCGDDNSRARPAVGRCPLASCQSKRDVGLVDSGPYGNAFVLTSVLEEGHPSEEPPTTDLSVGVVFGKTRHKIRTRAATVAVQRMRRLWSYRRSCLWIPCLLNQALHCQDTLSLSLSSTFSARSNTVSGG